MKLELVTKKYLHTLRYMETLLINVLKEVHVIKVLFERMTVHIHRPNSSNIIVMIILDCYINFKDPRFT